MESSGCRTRRALETLAAAFAELEEAAALERWTTTFPANKGYVATAQVVGGLPMPNGSSYRSADVLAALASALEDGRRPQTSDVEEVEEDVSA